MVRCSPSGTRWTRGGAVLERVAITAVVAGRGPLLMDQYMYQPRDIAQYVLSTERGELGERYGRAAHWARKADLE